MTTTRATWAVALAGGLLLTSGCSSTQYRRSTGAYLDDTGTTARLKMALMRDPVVKGTAVNVDVFRGNTALNGFVASEEQKQRAEEIARTIPGVEFVSNNLTVKSVPMDSDIEAMGATGGQIQTGTASETQGWYPADSSSRQDVPPRSFGRTDTDRRELMMEDTPPADIAEPADSVRRSADAGAGIEADAALHNVRIQAANGSATIEGSVPTFRQKQQIEFQLLEVPGIEHVDNRLVVGEGQGAPAPGDE